MHIELVGLFKFHTIHKHGFSFFYFVFLLINEGFFFFFLFSYHAVEALNMLSNFQSHLLQHMTAQKGNISALIDKTFFFFFFFSVQILFDGYRT